MVRKYNATKQIYTEATEYIHYQATSIITAAAVTCQYIIIPFSLSLEAVCKQIFNNVHAWLNRIKNSYLVFRRDSRWLCTSNAWRKTNVRIIID